MGYQPYKENKLKKKEKGDYPKKKLREAAKQEESESEWEEFDEDPLGLEQEADKQDPGYRPYKAVKRRKGSNTAYYKVKGRRDETKGGRVMELDQNPLREQERRGEAERRLEGRRGVSVPSVQLARIGQEKETKSKNNKKRKLSWFPAAVLFLCLLAVTIRAAPANSNIKPLLFVDGVARVDYPSGRWSNMGRGQLLPGSGPG